jgi:competence protein ComEA
MSAPVPAPAADPGQGAASFHFASYLLGLVTALVLLGGLLLLLRRPDAAAVELHPPPVLPTAAPTVTPAPPTPSPLVVFVSGAVRQPGLYSLPAGARIGDALAAAGGLLPDVDPALVNQAQPLIDGAQLHIPGAGAEVNTEAAPGAGASGREAGADAGAEAGSDAGAEAAPPLAVRTEPLAGLSAALPTPTPLVPTSVAPTAAASSGAASPVNVNSATAAELEALPGIGPAKAQAIIENRPYAAVDELDRVPGIGPATLERLRPLVTTG